MQNKFWLFENKWFEQKSSNFTGQAQSFLGVSISNVWEENGS